MLEKLEKRISAITILAAVAYALGWVKTSSYFQTFGIGLSQLDIGIKDYLFESWYAIENVLFFVLFSWVLHAGFRLKFPRKLHTVIWYSLLAVMGLTYLMVPLATAGAFARITSVAPTGPTIRHLYYWLSVKYCSWLLIHYYSVLKFAPFALYLAVLSIFAFMVRRHHRKWESLPETFRPPRRHDLLVLYLVVVAGWSISLAKHIGEIDAKNTLACPEKYLSQVVLHLSEGDTDLKKLLTDDQRLYSLYESHQRFFILDRSEFNFLDGSLVRILIIPSDKVRWVDGKIKLQMTPGPLFF